MLYAMSTMDKVKLEKIKESAQKTFGKPNVDKQKIETTRLVDEMKVLEKQLVEAKKTIEELQKKIVEQPTPPPTVAPTPDPKEEIKKLQEQLQKVEQEKKEIEQQKQELEKTVEALQSSTDKSTVTQQQVETLKKENKQLKEKLVTTQDTLKETQNEVKKLEEEIAKIKAANSDVAFMAFMMKWPTNDHDVDLKVEDPGGRKFDFKHRKYGKEPGTFVLDTRRGPGMEVWQSDRIVPGVYKFTYQFYNAYGNNSPCPVTATLFTSKGSVDLPKVTLDLGSGKREHAFKVRVDEKGQATLLP
jgi:hypothetical protein